MCKDIITVKIKSNFQRVFYILRVEPFSFPASSSYLVLWNIDDIRSDIYYNNTHGCNTFTCSHSLSHTTRTNAGTNLFGMRSFLSWGALLVSHFCQLANKCCQIALRLLAINNGTFVIYTHKLQQTLKREKTSVSQCRQSLDQFQFQFPPPQPRTQSESWESPAAVAVATAVAVALLLLLLLLLLG